MGQGRTAQATEAESVRAKKEQRITQSGQTCDQKEICAKQKQAGSYPTDNLQKGAPTPDRETRFPGCKHRKCRIDKTLLH